MASVLHAVRPNESLIAQPEQKDRILQTYIELASAKPVDRAPKKL